MTLRPFSCLLLVLGLCLQPAVAREATMQLPEALSGAERLVVSGRQGWKIIETLKFGDVRIFDVDRSLTRGGDLGLLFYQGSKRRQTFGFSVIEGDGPRWQGAAVTNLRRRSLTGDGGSMAIDLKDRSGFAANLAPADRPGDVWVLDLSERGERSLKGTLRHADAVFTVKGTDRLAGTRLPLGETSGYVIEWGSQVLAAVEVINRGAVWIAPDIRAGHREAVVAAVASLLLFESLRATLPE